MKLSVWVEMPSASATIFNFGLLCSTSSTTIRLRTRAIFHLVNELTEIGLIVL